MSKRSIVLALGVALILAGCAKADAGYRLSFDSFGQTRPQQLLDASVRMLRSRLDAMGQSMKSEQAALEGEGAVVRFAAQDSEALASLTQAITTPFTFRVMLEAPKEQADLFSEQYGGFRETGITEKVVTWVEAASASGGRGTVVIGLTPEGQALLGKVFTENDGKELGIFVRGRLMSRKFITTADRQMSGSIQIDNVPSEAIASVFADDVNVGAHVTFQPLAGTEPSQAAEEGTGGSSSAVSVP